MHEYALFTCFFSCVVILGGLLPLINKFCSSGNRGFEKTTPYECGFEPFADARGIFDFQFFITAILFILFDVELFLLFPWSLLIFNLGPLSFWAMISFLLLLILGFLYEWQFGALIWYRPPSLCILK